MSSQKHDGERFDVGAQGETLRGEMLTLATEQASAVEIGALFEELDRRIACERGLSAWLRSRPTWQRATLALAVIAAPALLVAETQLRPDMSVYPTSRMATMLLSLTVLLAFTLAVALRPLQRPAPAPLLTSLTVVGSLLGLLGLSLLPEAHHAHPASLVHGQGVLAQLLRAAPCFVIGLLVGSVIYALLVALDRGGHRRDTLFALCSGLAANLSLQLLCPVTAPVHMVLGHFGVALGLLVLARLRGSTA